MSMTKKSLTFGSFVVLAAWVTGACGHGIPIIVDDVGVNHRGGERGVTQCLLHQANVLALAVELSGIGVAQHVGMDVLGDAGFATAALDHFS